MDKLNCRKRVETLYTQLIMETMQFGIQRAVLLWWKCCFVEMIASVPANAATSMTIIDCNPSGSSASHSVYTSGSGSGAGAPLSGGAIDFTQATVTGFSMTYYGCQASTGDRQALYDVRWNIKTLSTNAKLVTVAAKPTGTDTHANFLAVPVSLKTIVGL